MQEQVTPYSFGTHDGAFHADDVTACALLLMVGLIQKERIIRTRDLALLGRCEFVCDVGGVYDLSSKRFDHHQREYTGPLSSAGMVLRYLHSTKVLPSNEVDFLNNSLIHGIDAHDNGKDPQIPGFCLFSHVITNFNPIDYEATAEEYMAGYVEAVDFTYYHLVRSLKRYQYYQSVRSIVKQVMNSSTSYLLFEQHIPWMDGFFEMGGEDHPAKFVVMPVGEQWKVRGIPPSTDNRMSVRIPLPSSWAGRMGQELSEISGIQGALFCHKGQFISMWKTREAALEAVDRVLSMAKQKESSL